MRFTLLLTLLFSFLVAMAADKTTEVFTLDHQMSSHCEKKIKENLRFEKGISKIDVSLKNNTITITYDNRKTDTAKILEAFKKIGFTAFVYNEEESQSDQNCCTKGSSTGCCQPQGSCCN